MKSNPLQIVIIAGGAGSRMQPLVTHKTIFPFLGLPILEHKLASLTQFPSTKTIIVAHPGVAEEVNTISKKYNASMVIQQDGGGMAGAILAAKELLNQDTPLLIGDAITVQAPSAYQDFYAAIQASPTSILFGGRKVQTYEHGGYFSFNEQGRILKIVEKPGPENMPSHHLKLVLDYFPDAEAMLNVMATAQSDKDDVYEVALSKMLTNEHAAMVELAGAHATLKHAPRVLDVMEVFLKEYLHPGIDPSAHIAPSATITGDVSIGKNVRIFENAVIKGPTYIGDNTIIGNGALVRESCIEANCEIGFNSEITRSYVGPGSKCHTSYVGDSIIEGECNLAAGTVTANLRFDGKPIFVTLPVGRVETNRNKFGTIFAKNVKTAIHTSLMPGTVIDSDCCLAPALMYKGYIENTNI